MTPGTYSWVLTNSDRIELTITPIPAALPLMLSGLAGLAWLRRRHRAAVRA